MKKRLSIFLIVAAMACSFCFAAEAADVIEADEVTEAAEEAIQAETEDGTESELILLPLQEVQLETETIQEEMPAETAEIAI